MEKYGRIGKTNNKEVTSYKNKDKRNQTGKMLAYIHEIYKIHTGKQLHVDYMFMKYIRHTITDYWFVWNVT